MENVNNINERNERGERGAAAVRKQSSAVITPLGRLSYEDFEELELIDFMTMLEEMENK